MRLYDPEDRSRGPGAALRWGAAGVLVAGLHLGGGWWIVSHPFAAPMPPDQAQGIPIDLEPIAVSQNAPDLNSTAAAGSAPAPQAAATPDPSPEPVEQPPPTPPDPSPPTPEPPQVAEALPPPEMAQPEATPPAPEPPKSEAAATPPDQPPPPPLPDTKSEAVLSPPPPPPRPKVPLKPDPRVAARDAAKRKTLAEKRERDRAAREEARNAARAQARAAERREGGGAAATTSAPSSASSGAEIASWRGAVLAHLNSFRPASTLTGGTVRVSFGVDRGGRVISATLAGSSGDPQLDQAALAMVRRASPVPAPPTELGGRVNVTVPVRFHGAAGGG